MTLVFNSIILYLSGKQKYGREFQSLEVLGKKLVSFKKKGR